MRGKDRGKEMKSLKFELEEKYKKIKFWIFIFKGQLFFSFFFSLSLRKKKENVKLKKLLIKIDM